jgi:F-type H+-transporting ATPase subunit delta
VARRDTGPRRYAEAAFEVAMRDSTLERWRADLDMATSLAGDQRALGVLANPAIAIDQRTAALDQMLGDRTSEGARNLIRLLLRRGRIEDLPRVASDLTDEEIRQLTARLEQSTGGRIALDVQVDPSLLGGIVVRVGDRLIDGSVRGRLERLRNQLISGAL